MGGAAAVKVALLCPASSVEVECGSTTVSAFGVSAGTGATHVARIEAAAARLRDCATARARIASCRSFHRGAGGCPIMHVLVPPSSRQAALLLSMQSTTHPAAAAGLCWLWLALDSAYEYEYRTAAMRTALLLAAAARSKLQLAASGLVRPVGQCHWDSPVFIHD
jgi:hypothetical protein